MIFETSLIPFFLLPSSPLLIKAYPFTRTIRRHELSTLIKSVGFSFNGKPIGRIFYQNIKNPRFPRNGATEKLLITIDLFPFSSQRQIRCATFFPFTLSRLILANYWILEAHLFSITPLLTFTETYIFCILPGFPVYVNCLDAYSIDMKLSSEHLPIAHQWLHTTSYN